MSYGVLNQSVNWSNILAFTEVCVYGQDRLADFQLVSSASEVVILDRDVVIAPTLLEVTSGRVGTKMPIGASVATGAKMVLKVGVPRVSDGGVKVQKLSVDVIPSRVEDLAVAVQRVWVVFVSCEPRLDARSAAVQIASVSVCVVIALIWTFSQMVLVDTPISVLVDIIVEFFPDTHALPLRQESCGWHCVATRRARGDAVSFPWMLPPHWANVWAFIIHSV